MENLQERLLGLLTTFGLVLAHYAPEIGYTISSIGGIYFILHIRDKRKLTKLNIQLAEQKLRRRGDNKN